MTITNLDDQFEGSGSRWIVTVIRRHNQAVIGDRFPVEALRKDQLESGRSVQLSTVRLEDEILRRRFRPEGVASNGKLRTVRIGGSRKDDDRSYAGRFGQFDGSAIEWTEYRIVVVNVDDGDRGAYQPEVLDRLDPDVQAYAAHRNARTLRFSVDDGAGPDDSRAGVNLESHGMLPHEPELDPSYYVRGVDPVQVGGQKDVSHVRSSWLVLYKVEAHF